MDTASSSQFYFSVPYKGLVVTPDLRGWKPEERTQISHGVRQHIKYIQEICLFGNPKIIFHLFQKFMSHNGSMDFLHSAAATKNSRTVHVLELIFRESRGNLTAGITEE